jgi:phosphoribosylformylglycinamidine synthase
MSNRPKVLILRTAGTNCDSETAAAFRHFGASTDLVHINKLFDGSVKLADYHILAVPGGFSYGDDIESGRILANELRGHLAGDLRKFIDDKKLIIGICNGFQVLVRAGILPGNKGDSHLYFDQTVTLINNDSGKFEDRWCHLKVEGKGPWLEGVGGAVYFPIAHAEGKFIPQDDALLQRLKKNKQIAFRYVKNPNGSVEDIAGITDETGRILGLMPHPERHFFFYNHPQWTRHKDGGQVRSAKTTSEARYGDGAKIFENGVRYVKENLLKSA